MVGYGDRQECDFGGITPPKRRTKQILEDPIPLSLKNVKRRVDWTPYTFQDYKKKYRSKTYYELGGLGPFNVGRDEWVRQRIAYNKRLSYGNKVQISNYHTISRSLGGKSPL